MKTSPTHQKGFSLIELLLALGIGILVMAAAYAAYDTRRSDAEVAVLDADIDALIYKANMAYLGSGSYTAADAAAVVQPISATRLAAAAGGLPNAFDPSASSPSGYRNFWGGVATLGAESTDGGTTQDLFTITLQGIAPRECVDIVGRIAARMYDTRVNNGLVGLSPARSNSALGRSDIRVSQVVPLCQQAANDIKFRYLKPLNYSLMRSLPVASTFKPGQTPNSDEQTAIAGNFTRIEAAMTAREAAQVAIP